MLKNCKGNIVLDIAKILYIGFSYFFIDALLRVMTRHIQMYSIYAIEPSLFSICWIIIIVSILSYFNRNTGRLLYLVSFLVFGLYSFAQYTYYLIFNKFIFFADLFYLSEGTEFTNYLYDLISPTTVFFLFMIFAVGIFGYYIFPDFQAVGIKRIKTIRIISFIAAITGIAFIPKLYAVSDNELMNPSLEYEMFSSSSFDLELTGYYQFLARDAWITYLKPKKDSKKTLEMINEYLKRKEVHHSNEMTGLLKNKNLLIIQLETIDDWMLSEEFTPNILKLMNEGINFVDFYTPCYGSGWTFGTEFAFNTGVFQGEKTLCASKMSRNKYPYTLANILSEKGYTCNSIHENVASFYNRSYMHRTLGYQYHCAKDYMPEEFAIDDSLIVKNDEIWNLITDNEPFCSYIIAFSPHLPYNSEDSIVQYALKKYPQYKSSENEVDNLLLKSKLTDEMIGVILDRLENDGLIDNTAIVVFDDHYSYGLKDKEKLKELSLNAGSEILEKTPAFIWYKGCEHIEVDKTCQIIDLLPTIANLLDIDLTDRVLGHDIFNDLYAGFAILPSNTWISGETYVKNGLTVNQGNLTSEEINQMNQFVNEFYNINNGVLESDYYAHTK